MGDGSTGICSNRTRRGCSNAVYGNVASTKRWILALARPGMRLPERGESCFSGVCAYAEDGRAAVSAASRLRFAIANKNVRLASPCRDERAMHTSTRRIWPLYLPCFVAALATAACFCSPRWKARNFSMQQVGTAAEAAH